MKKNVSDNNSDVLMNQEEAVVVNKSNDRNQNNDEMTSRAAGFKDTQQEAMKIPQFDLAEEIMAEQRKIASTKRKGPGKKVVKPAKRERSEPIAPVVEMFRESSEEEQVIAEIVARDIKQLCTGNIAGLQR